MNSLWLWELSPTSLSTVDCSFAQLFHQPLLLCLVPTVCPGVTWMTELEQTGLMEEADY